MPTRSSNFETYLTLSQTFEDLGVAAYKGQAGNLIANDGILQTALQIHSVEARHAAIVRKIGGKKIVGRRLRRADDQGRGARRGDAVPRLVS